MNFAVALRESGTYFGTPKRCATRTAICNAEHQDHARLLRHELRQQPDGEGGGAKGGLQPNPRHSSPAGTTSSASTTATAHDRQGPWVDQRVQDPVPTCPHVAAGRTRDKQLPKLLIVPTTNTSGTSDASGSFFTIRNVNTSNHCARDCPTTKTTLFPATAQKEKHPTGTTNLGCGQHRAELVLDPRPVRLQDALHQHGGLSCVQSAHGRVQYRQPSSFKNRVARRQNTNPTTYGSKAFSSPSSTGKTFAMSMSKGTRP